MDWEAAFQTRILAPFGARRPADATPRWIFVCGQPGSGKSTRIRKLLQDLGADRTQLIGVDLLTGAFPEFFDEADPAGPAAFADFKGGILDGYIDRLVRRATDMRAHILWERPNTGDIEGLALVARSLGYRVECEMLAVPVEDSWIASVRRSLELRRAGEPVVFDVSWSSSISNSRRWPALLARIEEAVQFDVLSVIDREGTVCFQNSARQDRDLRVWQDPAFGFESLVIERARPRSAEQMQRLIASWDKVMADPEIAFRNHPAWPWDSIAGFRQLLADLAADPGTGFDLNAPGGDVLAASRWIDRLRATLDDILTGPEAAGQPGLAARADRLMALISRVAGQPIR